MIIQQVNLYQENLKPQQLNADIPVYLGVIVMFFLILIGFSIYFQHELDKNKSVAEQIQEKLNAKKTTVKQLQDSQPKPQSNTNLIAETKQWQKKVADFTQTLAMLENETNMQTQGFSGYFLALANQSVSGVWLSVIHFDARQEMINFEGSTFKVDEIPVFLQRLQKEPVFHGRSFAKLAVEKSAKTPNLMNFKLSTHLPALKKNHAE
jgi:hypothetical protein